MSEIALAASSSCLSGTRALIMAVNCPSSLMKKKLMNTTEKMPIPRLEITEAAEPKTEEKTQDLPDEYFKVLEIVGKYFENNISLKRSATGKGSMTIHFSSDEEVKKFLKALEDSKF